MSAKDGRKLEPGSLETVEINSLGWLETVYDMEIRFSQTVTRSTLASGEKRS